jgi:hypothetical protein
MFCIGIFQFPFCHLFDSCCIVSYIVQIYAKGKLRPIMFPYSIHIVVFNLKFSTCEIVVKFISLITFSFNLDGYFPCYGEAKSYHLGF